MSDDRDKRYEGMYCPLRQSDVQALKCLEKYCHFWTDYRSPSKNNECTLKRMARELAIWAEAQP